jgi:predicted NUDIX family NTP pyrophosphohydrolase
VKKHSAGLIVYRIKSGEIEVILGHMGGPWFAKKDVGAWSIPKGLIEKDEDHLEAAKREFNEEFGIEAPEGEYLEIGTVEQHNKKLVSAWGVKAEPDISTIKSNTFMTEWPPKSGKKQEFFEIDRAAWFNLKDASVKAVKGQSKLFELLAEKLGMEFTVSMNEDAVGQGSLF